MFEGENLRSALRGARYPEDFDFSRLVQELNGKVDLSSAISEWALRDRDAAWGAVKPQLSQQQGQDQSSSHPYEQFESLRSLVRAVVAKDGETNGMQWALTQLSPLDPARRLEYLRGLSMRNEFSPEGIAAMASSLPPDERFDYASSLARSGNIGPSAYAAIETLPRENLLYLIHRDIYHLRSGPEAIFRTKPEAFERLWSDVRTRFQLTPEEISRITSANQQDPR
ncbi:MAG: hypothetical protein EOP83_24990 [Verrucomicrobiaceae bacterium]|nr:MAG: hypothetical protein EOP83_24990 [Verrucomicrobiaceae bacterium]